MEVTTISMDPSLAYQKFLRYADAYKRSRELADKMLMRTYKQLSEGRQIINLRDALQEAGLDDLHRPRFAVARADKSHVWYSRQTSPSAGSGNVIRFSTYDTARRGAVYEHQATGHNMDFAEDLWPECPPRCTAICEGCRGPRSSTTGWPDHQGRPHIPHPTRLRAMVPIIPPELRPADALSNYVVLWDVKGAWMETPPRDPFLLKRVEGDLYAVHAVWDLTDLEMAVLKGLRGAAPA